MQNVFSVFPTYFAHLLPACQSENLFLNFTVGLYKALKGLRLKYIFDLLLRYESSSPPLVCLLFPESTPNTKCLSKKTWDLLKLLALLNQGLPLCTPIQVFLVNQTSARDL